MENEKNSGTLNTKAIRKRMIDKGFTAAELADEIGVSVSYMSVMLNNKRPMKLEIAERVQEALEIPDSRFAYYFLSHETERNDNDSKLA